MNKHVEYYLNVGEELQVRREKIDAAMQEQFGQSVGTIELLMLVDGADTKAVELAARLRMSPSGLTRRLDAAQDAGLTKRNKTGATDKRAITVQLTAKGQQMLKDARPIYINHVKGLPRHLAALDV